VRRFVEWQFDFLARYEVEQLERIDRSGGVRVVGYPGAVELDPQQELSAGPIIRVRPASGPPWVAVFRGEEYRTSAAFPPRLFGWPDERSICVVVRGSATVVRTDAPEQAYEIDAFPVTAVLASPGHGLILFSDFTRFVAYDSAGLRWQANVASDEATLLAVEGDHIVGVGFLHGVNQHPIRLDMRTGSSVG
jgi:hypothetical protein